MILITEFMDAGSVRMMESSHPTLYDPDLADHPDDILDRLPGVVALIVRNRTQVTAELLAAAPDLGIVGRLGVGLDNIDLEACVARGVEVIPATGANARSVAEYVITCAFMLLRNAYSARSELLAGHWPRENCSLGREAGGHRLGLVGFGQTARETARLARGLDMEVIAFDPFLSDASPAWDGITPAPLDRLLGRSDVVSLHVPLNEDTHHLIDSRRLALMRPGSILINASRGGVVDETALANAMRTGHIAGAALDVFETEPLSEEAAERFRGLDNLVLTPHIAGVTRDSNARVSALIAKLVLERI